MKLFQSKEFNTTLLKKELLEKATLVNMFGSTKLKKQYNMIESKLLLDFSTKTVIKEDIFIQIYADDLRKKLLMLSFDDGIFEFDVIIA